MKGQLNQSLGKDLAGTTGLEPATSDVTGRRSNQLNYVPAILPPQICGVRQVGDFQDNTVLPMLRSPA